MESEIFKHVNYKKEPFSMYLINPQDREYCLIEVFCYPEKIETFHLNNIRSNKN